MHTGKNMYSYIIYYTHMVEICIYVLFITHIFRSLLRSSSRYRHANADKVQQTEVKSFLLTH